MMNRDELSRIRAQGLVAIALSVKKNEGAAAHLSPLKSA